MTSCAGGPRGAALQTMPARADIFPPMARARGPRPQATPSGKPPDEVRPAGDAADRPGRWWPLLGVIAAGVAVFQGALHYFFAQDDFAGLARASGMLPRLSGMWRYLSGQLYFDVMWRFAGLQARTSPPVGPVSPPRLALLPFPPLARPPRLPPALGWRVLLPGPAALVPRLRS